MSREARPCVILRGMKSALLVALLFAPLLLSDKTPPREDGWVELFDGESLDGWVTEGGRYDGNAQWKVVDGTIEGRTGENGAGGLLYTEKAYTSFELELETWIDYPFDSGVFVRMTDQGLKGAQVTLDNRPGGEIGGIYADGYLQHNEEGAAKFKQGEWNHVRVRCTGFDMRLVFWLNGELVTDYSMAPGTPGYAPHGLIGVQVHGSNDLEHEYAARFKNVRIKELPVFADDFEAIKGGDFLMARAGARERGWRSLFDGESAEHWEGAETCVIEDGVLHSPKTAPPGEIRSKEDFQDFRFRIDFRYAEVANSGIYLRSKREDGNPSFTGCEIQILDDFNWERATSSKLADYQFSGSLYAAVPAGDHGRLRPHGEWNSYEILYQGSRLAVALNGFTLYDVNTLELEADPPFAERVEKGFIGMQRYNTQTVKEPYSVSFRNIFVQELARD